MVYFMENPIKMDDLGGFPPIFGNTQLNLKDFYKYSVLLEGPKSLAIPLFFKKTWAASQAGFILAWLWSWWSQMLDHIESLISRYIL